MPITHTDVHAARAEALLEPDEQRRLLQSWKERKDRAAGDRLVRAYARLAFYAARRMTRDPARQADLVQHGLLGILDAAETYDEDESNGKTFSRWASWYVGNACKRARLRTLSPHGMSFRGGSADVPDTANEVRERLVIASLEAPLGEDRDMCLGEILPDDGPLPDELAADTEWRERSESAVDEALALLPAREAEVLRARMEDVGLPELAERLGVSKQRVHQIEKRGMRRMKAMLAKRGVRSAAP